MASEQFEVIEGVRLRVGIPDPGKENIPDVIVEFAEEYSGPFEMDEVAKLLRMAVVQGWAAAFDYVHTNTGIWRANAIAHAEHIPGTFFETSKPPISSEIEPD